MGTRYLHPETLLETGALAERLGAPGLRVYECTTYLRYRPEGSDAP